MKRRLLVLFLLLASPSCYADMMSWLFGYDSFDECILDSMPGVENNQQAKLILKDCKTDYSPTRRVEKKQSYLEVETANACIKEYGQEFTSSVSNFWITRSCYRLFR